MKTTTTLIAALAVSALKESDGVFDEVRGVAEYRPAAAQLGRSQSESGPLAR